MATSFRPLESQQMFRRKPKPPTCPNCGSANLAPAGHPRADGASLRWLWKCLDCGTRMTMHRFTWQKTWGGPV